MVAPPFNRQTKENTFSVVVCVQLDLDLSN